MMSKISGVSKQLNALLACDPKERNDIDISRPSVVSQSGTSGLNLAAPGVRSERPDSHRPLAWLTTGCDGKGVHMCSCRHQPNARECAGRRSKSGNDQQPEFAPLPLERKAQCEGGQRKVPSRKPPAAYVAHCSISDSKCKGNPRGSRAYRPKRASLDQSTSMDA